MATPDHSLSPFWASPFVVLLACVALMPFAAKRWWDRHYPKVVLLLGAVSAAYYFAVARDVGHWLHGMSDYVSFILLLGSLYVVSGGIAISVNRRATPAANCAMLLLGAVAANVFGTTGAAMLLIRPYLRMNRGHVKAYHVVFFIFLVANVGGSLTPIGDPPLFLGYLYGVPFFWVLENARAAWLITVGVLLAMFFLIDRRDHVRGQRHANDLGPAVHILGIHNFLFIGLVLYAVFRDGSFDVIRLMRERGLSPSLVGRLLSSREVLMSAAALGSRLLTPGPVYEINYFSFGPIREVAILFLGIFSTMIPALQWLDQNAHRLPVRTAGQYYFTSGLLSSVLDNAPTYMTFLQVQFGKLDRAQIDQAVGEVRRLSGSDSRDIRPDLPREVRDAVQALVRYHPEDVARGAVSRQRVEAAFLVGNEHLSRVLLAISLGSVFFGACTYIGNGPNFMVKSIAASAGVAMPGFIGYVVRYALPFLIPAYVLVWIVFFARSG